MIGVPERLSVREMATGGEKGTRNLFRIGRLLGKNHLSGQPEINESL